MAIPILVDSQRRTQDTFLAEFMPRIASFEPWIKDVFKNNGLISYYESLYLYSLKRVGEHESDHLGISGDGTFGLTVPNSESQNLEGIICNFGEYLKSEARFPYKLSLRVPALFGGIAGAYSGFIDGSMGVVIIGGFGGALVGLTFGTVLAYFGLCFNRDIKYPKIHLEFQEKLKKISDGRLLFSEKSYDADVLKKLVNHQYGA